jgi:uncharacterized membrane protein
VRLHDLRAVVEADGAAIGAHMIHDNYSGLSTTTILAGAVPG